MAGYSGWKKLRCHHSAKIFRRYITLMQTAWTPLIFDFLCFHLLARARHEDAEEET